MDVRRFDSLTRVVGVAGSRRRLVSGIAGAMAGASLLEATAKKGGKGKKKKKDNCKVSVCHRTGPLTTPVFSAIEISCSAIKAHAAHGDTICAPGTCQVFTGCAGSVCQFANAANGTPCQAGDFTGTCTGGVCG